MISLANVEFISFFRVLKLKVHGGNDCLLIHLNSVNKHQQFCGRGLGIVLEEFP